jgi:hypothetical protein
MDAWTRRVLRHVPLGDAVWCLWRWIADPHALEQLFERFRGRAYRKVLRFATLVQLTEDALMLYRGSARRSFERADEARRLPVSIPAAYGKLGRVPIPLSAAFLVQTTDALRDVFPSGAVTSPPRSLRDFALIVLDGKAIKRVAKRLKALRGMSGGVLGGRALVALALDTGLALAMAAHPDGEVNDARLVPELLPQVRDRVRRPRLWVADRQFCDLVQLNRFTQEHDHFLVRYHQKVSFQRDTTRAVRRGRDRAGRAFREEWGWLGSPRDGRRRYVRRITLLRPREEAVILVTDLTDAERYPAVDLLDLYLRRWGIERMFQQVTEVFHLERLIGSTPEATVFQFAFCLVLYNLIQVIRAYVAAGQGRKTETISTEKLFEDVQDHLVACAVMLEPGALPRGIRSPRSAAELVRRLAQRLGSLWKNRWLKAPARKPNRKGYVKKTRTHGSVYRIVQASARKSASTTRGP